MSSCGLFQSLNLIVMVYKTTQEGVDAESELCLNIFMICYVLGHFTEKMALKLVILGICFGKVQFS